MSKKAFWVLGLFLWNAEVLAHQEWGVEGGKTVGAGSLAFEGGFEGAFTHLGSIRNESFSDNTVGIRAGFSYGALSGLDLGLRFTLNFGWGEIDQYYRNSYYYSTTSSDVTTGIKAQVLLKVGFFDTGFLSFAMKVEPGFLADFYSKDTVMGLALPVGFQLGLAFSDRVGVGILLDLPMVLEFGKKGVKNSFLLPILMGAGVDVFFTSNFLIHAALTMGPAINVAGDGWKNVHGGNVIFVAEVKTGIAFRF
ncbi:MAG: hypothetical protein FWC28_09000 [Proteobacteria bacterium]|nr:hypothetical protein [Cystobacterineae bacterium]MCL2258337.1 hypothetical protein [Cystobacterineae bacterium]MCL2315362.1 hypothetical protein [Pseudomonadota bacterium]